MNGTPRNPRRRRFRALWFTLLLLLTLLILGANRHVPSPTVRAAAEGTASITGRISRVSDDAPISDAWVYAMDVRFNMVKGVHSDTSGAYRIEELEAGQYYVFATAEGYGGLHYEQGYDDPSATLITVGAAQTVPSIDIRLSPETTVSGHVFRQDGTTPLEGVTVDIFPYHGGQIQRSTTDSSGAFVVHRIAAGEWVARASAQGFGTQYFQNETSWEDATILSLTQPNEYFGVDFTLAPAGAISGHVFEADGVTPIADVWLWGQVVGGNWDYDATTGSDGSYSMSGLPSGSYRIKAGDDSHALQWYHLKPNPETADSIVVTAPNTTGGIDFKLAPGGAIAGRVFKADGTTPLSDDTLNVCAIPTVSGLVDNCAGHPRSDGSYSIGGLTENVLYKVQTRDSNQSGWATEYYNNKTDSDSADTVLVKAAQTIGGIDFTLDRRGSISGVVYQADGTTPIPFARVAVGPQDSIGNRREYCADDQGAFTLPVDLGAYKLFARGGPECGGDPHFAYQYYGGGQKFDEAAVVAVTEQNRDVSGITFALDPGGAVSGTVYDESGKNPLGGGVVEFVSANDDSVSQYICSNDDGTYTLAGLSYGNYKIYARGFCKLDSRYVREYWQEAYTWEEATPIAIDASQQDRSGIDFSLTLGGSLSGHVYGPDGKTPISDHEILVEAITVPAGTRKEMRYVQADGTYKFSALLPGDYKILANSNRVSPYVTKYFRDRLLEEEALVVTVSAGADTEDIDFILEKTEAISVTTEGGTLAYTDPEGGETTVTVPPGAVTQTVSLVYTPIREIDAPAGFALGGHAFELDVLVDRASAPGYVFEEPINVEIHYSDADVAAMDEDSLVLDFWDGETSAWLDAATTCDPPSQYTRDAAQNMLSVDICHLTVFAMLGATAQTYLPILER